MKILHMAGQSQVGVVERPEPRPGPGEVVVKTAMSALCGSEMKAYRTEGYLTGNMGHEAAGTVVDVGEGVDQFAGGERVGVSAIAGCGACLYCQRGQFTWCRTYRFYDNMHAEYFVIPALACHRLPDDVPWDIGVLITGDGLGVPYHTSRKIAGSETNTVAIFGLGPVGLGNVLMQSYLGRYVIGVDRFPERLQLAEALGAKATVQAEEGVDVVGRVQKLTGGYGADVCIEAAGVPATVPWCFNSVRTNGMVIFNGEQPAVELSPSEDFIRRDITAKGSWFYHFSEYGPMLDLYRCGLRIDSLITHRFPLEAAGEAYQTMQGRSGKILLTYGQ